MISSNQGCVERAPHAHLHVDAPQLIGHHLVLLPLVLDLDDLQQLGLPTPRGHLLGPALGFPGVVGGSNLLVPLVDAGDHVALEPTWSLLKRKMSGSRGDSPNHQKTSETSDNNTKHDKTA